MAGRWLGFARFLLLLATACFSEEEDCATSGAVLFSRWFSEQEAGLQPGGLYVVLGGESTAHYPALWCALKSGAKRAQAAPLPLDDDIVLKVDCTVACEAEEVSRAVVAFLLRRAGRYGVVFVKGGENAELTWLLNVWASAFWGQASCGHFAMPGLDEQAVDCSRILWAISTEFGSELLESELGLASTDDALRRSVLAAARATWMTRRQAGSLAVKASRLDHLLFVTTPQPSLFKNIAAAHFRRRAEGAPAVLGEFVGQIGAVQAVQAKLEALKMSSMGENAQQPPTVFYFYGVAGVGKTRLAELLAEEYGAPVIRLAMEAYGTEEDANALFGAPPGLEQGVCLVDLLLEQPRSVVIFDEIEKAHASMLGSKLHTALSTGTMQHKRDARKIAYLSKAVFVFTTNCYEEEVRDVVGLLDDEEHDSAEYYRAARKELSRRVNQDSPRARCSRHRESPFADSSVRSRLPPNRQFPFLPLRHAEMRQVVDVELQRQNRSFCSFELAWSVELLAHYAGSELDARATIGALREDLESALLIAKREQGNLAVLYLGREQQRDGLPLPKIAWLSSEAATTGLPQVDATHSMPLPSNEEAALPTTTAEAVVAPATTVDTSSRIRTAPALVPRIMRQEAAWRPSLALALVAALSIYLAVVLVVAAVALKSLASLAVYKLVASAFVATLVVAASFVAMLVVAPELLFKLLRAALRVSARVFRWLLARLAEAPPAAIVAVLLIAVLGVVRRSRARRRGPSMRGASTRDAETMTATAMLPREMTATATLPRGRDGSSREDELMLLRKRRSRSSPPTRSPQSIAR